MRGRIFFLFLLITMVLGKTNNIENLFVEGEVFMGNFGHNTSYVW